MNVKNMENEIKNAMHNRIEKESRAMHGTIKNGRFYSGNTSYPAKQAVECNTRNGNKVWAVKSNGGKAVIIGA